MAEVRVGVFRVLGTLSLEEQEELDRTSDKNALVWAEKLRASRGKTTEAWELPGEAMEEGHRQHGVLPCLANGTQCCVSNYCHTLKLPVRTILIYS